MVTTLYEDRRGELWIVTFRGGLDRFDRASGTFHHYRNDLRDRRPDESDVSRGLRIDIQCRVREYLNKIVLRHR